MAALRLGAARPSAVGQPPIKVVIPDTGSTVKMPAEKAVPDGSELPSAIADRLPLATAHAEGVVARAERNPHADALLTAARQGQTAAQRVLWLQKAASAWSEPLVALGACRRGCSHCCHIPVAISDVEARVIGKAVGREPVRPAGALSTEVAMQLRTLPGTPAAGYGDPCPFLDQGECSIYAHRPLSCRAQVNLDADDLLCRLQPGVEIPVPYADATKLKALYVMFQPAALWADIRAFFRPD